MVQIGSMKNKLRILSVEDSPLDANIVYEYLCQNSNSEIIMDIVFKKIELVTALSTKKYDIILADFRMPEFDGFMVLDLAKKISPSTPVICLSGYIGEETAVELLKQGATDYVSKDKLGRLIFSIDRALRESKESEEKEMRTAELIRVNRELTVQNAKISYLNYHDFLTGLYNRTFFEEEKKRLDTPRQLPISILMGDINGLKLINDGFGHPKGDEILIEIAGILKSCCREEDIVARIGGDEFGILLPQTDSKTAQILCNRIYDACKIQTLIGNSIYPNISIGHATKTLKTESMDDISMMAEESMAKHKLLESKSAHSSLIASIKVIMFEKSQETEIHTERLGQLAKQIGTALSLNDDQLNDLELLSTLHDIGKMSITPKVLSKPGKLSSEEWIEMRKHPEVGFRIAQASSELIPIASYILCHHERWDGKGYPQGLTGDEIPLLSRILAIVDAYDAMTNDRVYRPAMTKEEAIEEIKNNSGTQFDPELASLFLTLIT
jgi:diguanylate cyclase (GGDEF)-like protein